MSELVREVDGMIWHQAAVVADPSGVVEAMSIKRKEPTMIEEFPTTAIFEVEFERQCPGCGSPHIKVLAGGIAASGTYLITALNPGPLWTWSRATSPDNPPPAAAVRRLLDEEE